MMEEYALQELGHSIYMIESARRALMDACKEHCLSYSQLLQISTVEAGDVHTENYKKFYEDVLGKTFTKDMKGVLPISYKTSAYTAITKYVGGDLTAVLVQQYYGIGDYENLPMLVGKVEAVADYNDLALLTTRNYLESGVIQLRDNLPSSILIKGDGSIQLDPYSQFYMDVFDTDFVTKMHYQLPNNYMETVTFVLVYYVPDKMSQSIMRMYYGFDSNYYPEYARDQKKISEHFGITEHQMLSIFENVMRELRCDIVKTLLTRGIEKSKPILNKKSKSFLSISLDI